MLIEPIQYQFDTKSFLIQTDFSNEQQIIILLLWNNITDLVDVVVVV